MITKDNLKDVLGLLGFKSQNYNLFSKTYSTGVSIKVDFESCKIIYPPQINKGDETTSNFAKPENFVVLECVNRLLDKGYKAEHIILEPRFKLGRNSKPGGKADILVKNEQNNDYLIIECKTPGAEFQKEWKNMQSDGGQLFSYLVQTQNTTSFLCLYTSYYEEQKIQYKSYIVETKDNKESLEYINQGLKDDEKKLGFEDEKVGTLIEKFKVWKDTYGLGYTTLGLFEKDIMAYNIGKNNYTKDDLSPISFSDIRTIYNDFATILRNNAIGDYEHTFYILVDLFLCKIIDEKNNSDNLQFYYKGITRDNPLSYCDRLLNLYEEGVKELFDKKVVNHKSSEIESIFRKYKRYMGKLKDEIERMLKEQRFYAIKKFDFIKVENKAEFELNFRILIQITNLIQNIKITSENSGANQFLGDLFEGFLNRSVHQTEGRFFTPTPITNFIIRSLPPLEAKDPRVLDYACGAGHFLSEYIQYNQNSNAKLFGIEKNPELSRVAKIATYFYDDNATIVFQDTLGYISEKMPYYRDFLNNSFDLIISNPPYSVKGFLSTLDDIDRKKFKLTENIDTKAYDTNKSIECFFIERAEQFLKEKGLIAVVLPVSMLNKENIYSRTRDIIFNSFEILSIVELGSRTFGSTGTQTFILFARKKTKNIDDLITCFKENNFDLDILSSEFENADCVEKYCEFRQIDKDDFIEFLCSNILSSSLEEYFSEQKDLFDDDSKKANEKGRFKKTKPKNLDIQTAFESSSYYDPFHTSKEQKEDIQNFKLSDEYNDFLNDFFEKQFIEICKEIELEKLSLFAKTMENELIVVKSPNDKKQEKKNGKAVSNKDEIIKFLGYDWSKRKGDEGIKYESSKTLDNEPKENNDDNDDEKKDKETISNINSIKYINTALYNPQDKNDKSKINYILHSFFARYDDTEKLIANLELNPDSFSISTLIEFNRSEFSNAININNINNINISSPFENAKYELVKLGDYILEQPKSKIQVNQAKENESGIYPFFTSGENVYKYDEFLIDNENIFLATGGNACVKFYDGKAAYSTDTYAICAKNDEILTYYIFVLLKNKISFINEFYFKGMGLKHLQKNDFKNIKIPLPPLDIQTEIVKECEKIETKFKTIRMSVEEYQNLIKNVFEKYLY